MFGIKCSYDDDGKMTDRYFTIRVWRFEFCFHLEPQDARVEHVAAFESEPRDPFVVAVEAELAAEMFAAGVRLGLGPPMLPQILGLDAQMTVHQPEQSPEPACTCIEEKTFAGTRTILCRRPGCKSTAS
jgi:hypothetical protein